MVRPVGPTGGAQGPKQPNGPEISSELAQSISKTTSVSADKIVPPPRIEGFSPGQKPSDTSDKMHKTAQTVRNIALGG